MSKGSERPNRFAYLAILAGLLFILAPSPGHVGMTAFLAMAMVLAFFAYRSVHPQGHV